MAFFSLRGVGAIPPVWAVTDPFAGQAICRPRACAICFGSLVRLAAEDKCLARNNKSQDAGKATKSAMKPSPPSDAIVHIPGGKAITRPLAPNLPYTHGWLWRPT